MKPFWRSVLIGGSSALIVMVVIPIISIIIGFKTNATTGFVSFPIMVCLFFLFARVQRENFAASDKKKMEAFLLSLPASCNYKYAWDKDAIGIDATNKIIHLKSSFSGQPVSKVYSFVDVREWGYEIPGYETTNIIGNAGASAHLQVGAQNIVSLLSSTKGTGLWLKVKDIDFPMWFINFGHNPAINVKNELQRWMEILQQNINES